MDDPDARQRKERIDRMMRGIASQNKDEVPMRVQLINTPIDVSSQELHALDYGRKQKELLRKAFPEVAAVRRRRRWRGQ